MQALPIRSRVALALQREIGRFSAIFWIPSIIFTLRVVMRYRVKNAVELRKRYRALIKQSDGPVLICANHLTMLDSAILAWALGGSWWYVFHYRRMPWNLPERSNFASTWISRFAAWVTKCLPIVRDGPRQQVSRVMKRVQYLLSRGDTALIFTEGGRSRTGRVQVDAATHALDHPPIRRGIAWLAKADFANAADRRQRSPEFMRHVPGEPPHLLER